MIILMVTGEEVYIDGLEACVVAPRGALDNVGFVGEFPEPEEGTVAGEGESGEAESLEVNREKFWGEILPGVVR